MAEKTANPMGIKQREDGKLQEGEERTEGLVERIGRSAVRNGEMLRRIVRG